MQFISEIFSPCFGFTLSFLLFLSIFIKMYLLYFQNQIDYENLSFFFIIAELAPTFFSDLLVWIVSLFFVMLAMVARRKIIRLTYVMINALFLILFCIDLVTLYFAGFRLSVVELISMIGNGSSGASNIYRPLFCIVLLYGFLGTFFAFFISQVDKKLLRKITLFMIIVSTLHFLLLGFGKTLKKSELSNIFTLNFGKLFHQEKIIPETEKKYEDFYEFEKGDGKNPNIIFIFSESISATDSKKAGGENKLPLFDKVSDDGILLSRVVENGGTSDTAHIGALLGIEPLFRGSMDNFYEGYKTPTLPLAKYFANIGYTTSFISTVTLDFLNQRNFVNFVGFENIISEEAFKNKKTYVFNAAPDEDLYKKILEETKIKSQKSQPFFITAQTISFHTPYDTPYGKTEEDALKYIDNSFYDFYQELVDMDYFSSGILIVLGDHRKMIPVTPEEKANLGSLANYLSLGLIVGTGVKSGVIMDTPVQPTDFFYSLKKYTSKGEVYLKKNYNSIFGDSQKRNWMLVTSYYEEINKYHFVTFSGNEAKIIKEISFNDKEQKDEKINYLSSYLSYQLGGGKIEDNTGVIIIGNRGIGNGTQPNSLEGFYGAKKNNLRGIKFDVFYTKDKTNIIARGPNLWPSSCPTAHIYEKTFYRLKDNCTLGNGEKIMTLETMLNYIDGLFQYYFLEFKVDEKEKEKDKRQQTIDAIKNVKKQNMEDRVIFFSYDPIVREELLANTGIIIARDTYHPEDFKDKKIAQNPNIQYLMLPYDMLTEEVWEDIKKTNKKFVTYTINDTEILEQYLTGIDMTLSDNAVELINYLEKREKIGTENDASAHFPLESSLDIDTV